MDRTPNETVIHLTEQLKVIANPNTFMILNTILIYEEITPDKLHEIYPSVTLPTISYYLHNLYAANLITRKREGKNNIYAPNTVNIRALLIDEIYWLQQFDMMPPLDSDAPNTDSACSDKE